ncbi:uncharacterized protein Bfra_006514 [Botrytis fragariae]|uniref:DUF5672 domain-containing protein n=1 Tax=Botrytis fragariae TaxID=1964551 RepID=A0A8H6B4N0_9HELO|nr:uncharacterized protein Bfra_006514 [Botrytis fragariae]KAF5879306.1 hypothetical protein Bfra_006514 [Botrytis fragariae]
MSSSPSRSSPLGNGVLVINKTRILLLVALIATWWIAHFLPRYRPVVEGHIKNQLSSAAEKIPAIKVDWYPNHDPRAQFNASKVALLIEGRTIPHLVPQILHMISVVPPDWRFVFIGTNKSVEVVSRSFATQYHKANGKLDLIVLPKPWKVDSKEDIFRVLTDIRFYDEFMPEVEWLLKYESDSIMCGNSEESLNDWLDYDWAGAPRIAGDHFAGNGGLSFRRISTVKRILGFQSRINDTAPEDEWYGKRITVLPGARVASGEKEDHFSVEDRYHERPMGFHVRDGGKVLPEDVWRDPDQRKKIFEYCPELAMIMPMKLERQRCPGDNRKGELVKDKKDGQ